MQTTLSRSIAALLAAMAVLALSGLVDAPPLDAKGPKVTERDIEEFVAAQGTFDSDSLLVPPVPNFLGSADPESQLGLSVDYAGLANETCGGVARTKLAGRVKEKALAGGRAEVSVELRTTKAITWVVDLSIPSDNPFGKNPVVFGVRWQEDEEGNCVIDGKPALGKSKLKVKFINPEPGAPLPDLSQLLFSPEPGQEILSISVHAEATGKLPDGRPARAETHQVAKVQDGELQFSVENVFVKPLDQ